MRARLIISIGWVLSNIHRIWNNIEPVNISPFPFFHDFPVTVQWHIYLLSVKVFPMSILIASYYGIRKKDYTFIGMVLALELLNYLLWYSTNEIILAIQGFTLIIMTIKKWK